MSANDKLEFPHERAKRLEEVLMAIIKVCNVVDPDDITRLTHVRNLASCALQGWEEVVSKDNASCTHNLSKEEVFKAALILIADDHVDSFSTPASARRNIAHAALDGCQVFVNKGGTIMYRPRRSEFPIRVGPDENYND